MDVKAEYYMDPDTGQRYVMTKTGGTTASDGSDAGAVVVDGLANNAVRVVAGATYNSTVILGFRILLEGSGTLTFTPNTSGATAIVVTAAEIAEMDMISHNDWPIACSTITAGTGMELLVYIPS